MSARLNGAGVLTEKRPLNVSAQVLRSLDAASLQALPAWTATPGEWAMVSGSLFFRVGFLLLDHAGALRAGVEAP